VLLGARNACRTEQVIFEIGFEGGVGVDRSKMRMKGVPNIRASMLKTTRDESNLGTRMGEKTDGGGGRYVSKLTNIEGKSYGENGEQW